MADPRVADQDALIAAIRSLQARRQQLEDRLQIIEEKKALTAPAVYDKVRQETEQKLTELVHEAEKLRPLAEECRDRARSGGSTARVKELQVELEELRFRNTLGEYAADEFARLEANKQAEIAGLGTEEGGANIETLDSFLMALGGAPPRASEPNMAESRPAPPRPSELRPPPPAAEPPPPPRVMPVMSDADLSEVESLFGSSPGFAVPAPPPRANPANDVDTRARPRASMPLAPEETTRDLGLRGPEPANRLAPFRPVLVVKSRDKERIEDTYELAPGTTKLGRSPDNDVILLEESVSRRHAQILVEDGQCIFEDLGSANGSYINSEKLRPRQSQRLEHNDIIKMGQLLALFRVNSED